MKEDAPTHNTPFRAGKGYVYEGGLRIPLIVRMPKVVPSGKVSDTPVINTDWLSTILDLCGVPFEANKSDGVSLAPLLKGGSLAVRPLLWHFPHYNNQGGRPAGAIRIGDWKLIEHYEDHRLELFNLATDRSEEHDLATKEPKRVTDMQDKLAAWRTSVGAQGNEPNPDFDPAWYKRLYQDFDSSKLKPDATAAAMRNKLAAWRAGMDAVVAKPKKSFGVSHAH